MDGIFFSPADSLFYLAKFHGARLIAVNDPEAPDGVRWVPNPACRIPADAVEISAALYDQMLAAREQGATIQANAQGQPVAIPREVSAELIREKLRVQLNKERTRRERAGFPYRGKLVDADPDSVDRMTTAVLAAMAAQTLGQPFATSWTCADNTELPLDAAGMIGMPVAFARYGQALHDYCKARKAELPNLELAQLQNYDAAVGWPEG